MVFFLPLMITSTDPLQQALNTKRSYMLYQTPSSNSNFFKTQKYDFEYLGLSLIQRLFAFTICLVFGVIFLFYSFMRLPMAFISPMAFATPYAISNIMFFIMFGFISGFKSYFNNLLTENKRIYSGFFISSTFITLYASVFNSFKYFRFILMLIQFISFICFAITFLPGGTSGISGLISVASKSLFG